MRKRKRKENVPTSVAIFFLVVGLLLGTVFTFGMQYWGAPIEREEAVAVSAEYMDYRVSYSKGGISEIKLLFFDREAMFIDGACADDGVLEGVKALQPGARVEMLVHPNSGTVWELRQEERTVLLFENSQEYIKRETIGFTVMGIAVYALAAVGLLALIQNGIAKGKSKKKHSTQNKEEGTWRK